MNVLLTGATGFLGSYLLAALLQKSHNVSILKRSTSNSWRIEQLLPGTLSYNVDIDSLDRPFQDRKINVVIHTACNYGRGGQSNNELLESNLLFGLRVLDKAILHGADTFINTDTLLPKYLTEYSLSKKQFSEWAEFYSYRIKVVNLRLEHVYGPKDDATKFASWLISQLAAGVERIKLTKGEQKRDFIYVDDVVSAYLHVLENTSDLQDFEELDVGTGQLVTVRRFVELILNTYIELRGDINSYLDFGAIPYREGELMTIGLDISGLQKMGWNPKVSLEEGIRCLVAYNHKT